MKKRKISLVKFTVVAAMVGVFSPSVSVKPDVVAVNDIASYPFEINVSLLNTAEARGRRGGGAQRGNHRARSRPAHRPSGHRPPAHRPPNRPAHRPPNRNVNVNVNHRYYGGYGRGYGYYGGYPILAFTTGLAIGSIIASSTMPSSCTTVVVGGVSYRQCGSSYYMPVYQGDTLVYKVVASPY